MYKKPVNTGQRFIWWFFWLLWGEYPTEIVERPIEGVVEADDQTGLIIKQEFDKENRPIFTDGKDDIVLDNTVKLLLLTAPFRQAFHQSGFRPKLTTSYLDNVKIRYEGPPQTLVRVEQPEEVSQSTEVA